MTDNRTTELREKLTERGMKWVAYEKELSLALKDFHDTRWDASGVRWSYLEINGKATLSPVGRVEIELTPDQAIAATLGNGTLTADQVREAIERHSAWVIGNNRCFHDGAYEKIADELNAERHVETCRITASSTDGLCSDNPRHYFELSCGHSFTLDGLEPPNYCKVCGAKVIQGVDNAD